MKRETAVSKRRMPIATLDVLGAFVSAALFRAVLSPSDNVALAQTPAQIVINEIMYDPTLSEGDDWFDLYNAGYCVVRRRPANSGPPIWASL